MISKQELLTRLRLKDGFVSGQELCDAFGVSRTAIWKKIRQLQSEGYEIEAVSNRGYRLSASPDIIAAEEVLSRMRTHRIGREVRYFDTIDSTNQYAKKLGEQGAAEGVLVVADEQTAGKGRSGRSWSTPHGTAIAMTLLLRPRISPDRISMVTLVMGMAITQAVRSLYQLPAGIKWPNDVVLDGKKLSGTLTEMSCELSAVNYVVIGTGINANVKTFPEDLADTATSLSLALGREINRAELIAETVAYFETYYEEFLRTQDLSGLQDTYNGLLLNLDRQVRVLDPAGAYVGIARGIDVLGELLVQREDGALEKVYAGEVSVRGLYGYV